MTPEFRQIITTEDDLRVVLGHPAPLSVAKTMRVLDSHSRNFIARSPFMLIASSDGRGGLDVSPKGDPAGFVQVLDDTPLAIPDRPGNRRADTFRNLLQHPGIGLLFLVPGKADTLRVNGKAQIARDPWLLERMAVRGKTPALAIVVSVEEGFFHCAKCIIRSELWDAAEWPALDGMASLAKILADQTRLANEADMQADVDESYRDRLY